MAMPKQNSIAEMARILVEISNLGKQRDTDAGDGITERNFPRSSTKSGRGVENGHWEREIETLTEGERLLEDVGYFNDISPESFVFDEKKYSPSKRQLDPSEWDRTNRHLPIKIDPDVINKPGQRSPQAVKRVVEYTQFYHPRYVAGPGERATMCNIAAWDWSRALQVHLPHWIGGTEMSANMLFRWISHPQAGGIYGEGWQPVKVQAAKLLANRGIPVFALAENTVKGRHGHVAMVYPAGSSLKLNYQGAGPNFATVNNGRSHGGNGIKNLQETFRRLRPTYFVHKDDFVLYRNP